MLIENVRVVGYIHDRPVMQSLGTDTSRDPWVLSELDADNEYPKSL